MFPHVLLNLLSCWLLFSPSRTFGLFLFSKNAHAVILDNEIGSNWMGGLSV